MLGRCCFGSAIFVAASLKAGKIKMGRGCWLADGGGGHGCQDGLSKDDDVIKMDCAHVSINVLPVAWLPTFARGHWWVGVPQTKALCEVIEFPKYLWDSGLVLANACESSATLSCSNGPGACCLAASTATM